MTPLPTIIVLSLASWRLARLIAADGITEPFRTRIGSRWPATADEASVRWRHGAWQAIPEPDRRRVRPHGPGYLTRCPFCVSVWTSAAVVAVTSAVLSVPAPVLCWAAVAGGAALLHLPESIAAR